MNDAGYADQVDGFAIAPYSAWFEMRTILETIEGEINAASILDAFHNAGPTPGWVGPDLQCGMAPVPTATSHCGSQLIIWEIEMKDDGTAGRAPYNGELFFDAATVEFG